MLDQDTLDGLANAFEIAIKEYQRLGTAGSAATAYRKELQRLGGSGSSQKLTAAQALAEFDNPTPKGDKPKGPGRR